MILEGADFPPIGIGPQEPLHKGRHGVFDLDHRVASADRLGIEVDKDEAVILSDDLGEHLGGRGRLRHW